MEPTPDFRNDTPSWLQELRTKYNDDRFQQLNELLMINVTSTWTYLLTVNGGAAAGILAFIGAKSDLAAMRWPYAVLFAFVLGVVLVGFAHAFMVHKAQILVNGWVASIGAYNRNEIEWREVIRQDNLRVSWFEKLPWALGWLSLICFIGGVILAAWKFRVLAVQAAG